MKGYALAGRIRRYEWGSTTSIPALLGVEPDGTPVAELWFGAHPDDPSDVPATGRTLDALIADDPAAALGTHAVERFGPQLPFLMKVIAADKALSIQVHPDRDQARAGFAAEEASDVARTAPQRNYRDPNDKPELVCALTPFEGVCGFRPVAEIRAALDDLGVAELDFLRRALDSPDPLRSAFVALLGHAHPAELVTAVLAGLPALGRHDPTARAIRLAAQDFPHDIGTVLLLLLEPVRLAPGEAIFLSAGTVHCYLRGTAIEIMAASDNVLRCGLTPKHVDVEDLLRITSFAEGSDPGVTASADGTYEVPVDHFELRRVEVEGGEDLGVAGPRIVLCVFGSLQVSGVSLTPGHAAFVPAGERCRIDGPGEGFVGTVGG